MKDIFSPFQEHKNKNMTIDDTYSPKNDAQFATLTNYFKLPVKSPSSTRGKTINMNRTNSISNYNIRNKNNFKDSTFDIEEVKDDIKENKMNYYTPKEDVLFSNNSKKKCIGLKIKSRTSHNSNMVTMNNSNANTNKLMNYKRETASKNKPVKVNSNYTIDDSYKHNEIHFYNNNTNGQNMFLNFQNDALSKKGKNQKTRCYNSFDVNEKHNAINYDTLLSKLTLIYQIDESEQKETIKHKIKETSIKANKVDEYMNYFGDTNVTHVKNAIKRKEFYEKEMLLYKHLCEELIKNSDVCDLEELSAFVNEKISYSKTNENFLTEIKEIINSKYKTGSYSVRKQSNNKKGKKYSEVHSKYNYN